MKKLYTHMNIALPVITCTLFLLFFSLSITTNAQTFQKHDDGEHHHSGLYFHLTKDINPGVASSNAGLYANPSVAYGDKIFYYASAPETGAELYVSDGTEKGTFLLNDIYNGPESSSPNSFLYKNKRVYFIATNENHSAIYSTNGKSDGLKRHTAFFNTSYFVEVSNYTVADNGDIFYIKNHELRQSTGNPSSDHLLKTDLDVDGYLVTVKNTVFFAATDNVHGYELWKSDGTTANTKMVKDIYPGTNSSMPYSLVSYKNKLYFGAKNDAGYSFWRSDGSKSGTIKINNVFPVFYDYTENYMSVVYCISGNTLFFRGFNLLTNHIALWKTKGSHNTTKLVKDINPTGLAGINDLTDVNGTLFFTANDGIHGKELWKSDGKTSNTMLVKDIIPDGTIEQDPSNEYDYSYAFLTNVNGTLYFRTLINGNSSLWASRGKSANTKPVNDAIVKELTGFSYLVAADDKLFFSGASPVYGQELFVGEPAKHHDKDYDRQAEKLSYDKVITRLDATISPNPATSTAILHLTGSSANTIITMVDVTGKRIWQTRSKNDQDIRLPASIQKGVYFVVISSGQELRTVKFIKE